MEISDPQRLILHMLCDIHRALKIKGGFDPDFIEHALSSGNTWALKWQYDGIFTGEAVSEETVDEVCSILNMWEWIEHSYAQLGAAEKAQLAKDADPFGANPRFQGFDGNNEATHMSVADMLINRMGRWAVFKGRDLNAPMPTVDPARRMLIPYFSMGLQKRTAPMTLAQLTEVLKARAYPETVA